MKNAVYVATALFCTFVTMCWTLPANTPVTGSIVLVLVSVAMGCCICGIWVPTLMEWSADHTAHRLIGDQQKRVCSFVAFISAGLALVWALKDTESFSSLALKALSIAVVCLGADFALIRGKVSSLVKQLVKIEARLGHQLNLHDKRHPVFAKLLKTYAVLNNAADCIIGIASCALLVIAFELGLRT